MLQPLTSSAGFADLVEDPDKIVLVKLSFAHDMVSCSNLDDSDCKLVCLH